eukprot:TRINITY_DN9840_c0_g1_i5.p1 TRINITY_DN9840_c0_g1~~TRINITY_DN9840_c0_g1_i5.p1  ORF type:complete len:504 (+),score=51.42 TRINITY_DN9840_c0_g1_i5:230-1741(+)
MEPLHVQVDKSVPRARLSSLSSGINAEYGDRYGPQPTAVIGALMVFSGYFLLFVATEYEFTKNSVALGFFALLLGQGSGWGYTLALNTSIKNFSPLDRGKIVGILVCFFGLCSGIYTLFYRALFVGQLPKFFLFLSVVVGLVILVFGLLSNVTPNRAKEQVEARRILWCYGLGILLAFYLAVSSVLSVTFHIPSIFLMIPVCFMFSWFLFVLFGVPKLISFYEESHAEDENSDETGIFLGKTVPATRPSLTLLESAKTVEIWIVAVLFILTIGSGIQTVNHISDLVWSRTSGLVPGSRINIKTVGSTVNTLVILFSVFNTLGRMIFGVVSDRFQHKFDRPSWLILAITLMVIVQVYFAFSNIGMLYFGIVLLGVAYGGFYCVLPVMISEVYGVDHFGAIWGVLSVSPALGSYFFSTLIAGKLLDHFKLSSSICVATDSTSSCHELCYGSSCFSYTYFISAGASLIALILAVLLKWRLVRGPLSLPQVTKEIETFAPLSSTSII